MITVIQRVSEASVAINGKVSGAIGEGLLLLLGIETSDEETDVSWLVHKIVNLRIFSDKKGVMNINIKDVNGNILVISQFTLHASTRKGHRPSYINAAKPEVAIPLYNQFIIELEALLGKSVEKGIFGADMKVALVNDGPVTIILDSKVRK